MAVASSSAHFLCQNVAVYKPYRQHTGARSPHVRVSAACAATTTTTTAEGTRPCFRVLPQPPASSFYEVLGIRMSATCQEIKSAYRRLARTVHPDVAAPDTTAHEFVKIHEAYSTLSDPERRADYDRMLLGRRLKAVDLRSETSISTYPTGVGRSPASGYTRGRTWETDQCW